MAVWLRFQAQNLKGHEFQKPEFTRDAPARQNLMMADQSHYRSLGIESRATVRCVAGFPGLTAETFTVRVLRIMFSTESSLAGDMTI